MQSIFGASALYVAHEDGEYRIVTSCGYLRENYCSGTELITCAHPFVPNAQESAEGQELNPPVAIYVRNDSGILIQVGLVKKVWFFGRRGLDYCFVEDWKCNVVQNRVINYFDDTILEVNGLACHSMDRILPINFIGASVTRYGHQQPHRAYGIIYKFLCTESDGVVTIEKGGKTLRFRWVFIIRGEFFAQEGDSGGPVVVQMGKYLYVLGSIIGFGLYKGRKCIVVTYLSPDHHVYEEVEE